MNQVHAELLEEFQQAINRLVPLAPQELHDEAQKLHDELAGSEATTDRQIKQALVHLGKKEYPYRKAYQELCAGDEDQRLQEAALKQLEGDLQEKLQAVLQHGVSLLDYTRSKLFDRQLSTEEQYRVEQAISQAHELVNRQCDERAHERAQKFTELVARWQAYEVKVQGLIDTLRSLAERSPVHAAEIIEQTDRLEAGWSMVAPDPVEAEVKKEIESWMMVFASEENEGESDDELSY
jgi:hypothetical protein